MLLQKNLYITDVNFWYTLIGGQEFIVLMCVCMCVSLLLRSSSSSLQCQCNMCTQIKCSMWKEQTPTTPPAPCKNKALSIIFYTCPDRSFSFLQFLLVFNTSFHVSHPVVPAPFLTLTHPCTPRPQPPSIMRVSQPQAHRPLRLAHL